MYGRVEQQLYGHASLAKPDPLLREEGSGLATMHSTGVERDFYNLRNIITKWWFVHVKIASLC